MSDIKKFRLDIEVELKDAEKKLTTLENKAKVVKNAIDKAFQTNNQEALNKLTEKYSSLLDQIARKQQLLSDLSTKYKNNVANNEAKIAEAKERAYNKYIQNEEKLHARMEDNDRKREVSQTRAYDKYIDNKYQQYLRSEKRIQGLMDESDRLRETKQTKEYEANQKLITQEMVRAKALQDRIAHAQKQSDLNDTFGNLKEFASFQSRMNTLNLQAQEQYSTWRRTRAEVDKVALDKTVAQMKELNKESVAFHKTVGVVGKGFYDLNSNMDYFLAKMRSHIAWIGTGVAISALMAIPYYIEEGAKQAEVLGQKIKQNLELYEKYADNEKQLNEDVKSLMNTAGVFAVGYGADLKEVLDAMNIISRRFKDTNAINYITSLALTLHKLDFVPVTKAASDLEAVILQFGLNAYEVKDFVNQFSVAVHTARITGTELLDALQRSGSIFKQYGADTKTAIATISALATTTANTGTVIGNAWKSILSSTQKDKIQEAFKQLGIEMYTIGEAGEKVTKDLNVLFGEVMSKWRTFDQETRNKFAKEWAGQFQLNRLVSFLNEAFPVYEQLMQKLGTANDELTAKLLATGLDTYATRLDQLKASFQVLSTTIGFEVMPTLKTFTDNLRSGIEFLNTHREAVAQFITIITNLTEVLLVQKGAYFLLNQVQESHMLTTMRTIALEAGFSSAMGKMGNAVMGLAGMIAAATTRLLIFYAVAKMIGSIYDHFQEGAMIDKAVGYETSKQHLSIADIERGIKPQNSELLDKKYQYDAIRSEIGSLLKDGITNDGQKSRLNTLQEISGRLKEDIVELSKQSQVKQEVDKLMRIEKDARNHMIDPNLAKTLGAVGNQNIPGLAGGGGGGGRGYAPDASDRVFRDGLQLVKNEQFLRAKLSADRYAEAIENVNAKEDIFGKTTQTVATRLSAMRNRMEELQGEQKGYNGQLESLQRLLDDEIAKNADFQNMLVSDNKNWSVMTKQQKSEYVEVNKEYLQSHTNIMKILKLMDEYKSKISEASKELNKHNNEYIKATIRSPEEILNNKNQITKANERYNLADYRIQNRFNPVGWVEEADIKLRALQEEIKNTIIALEKTKSAIEAVPGADPETDAKYLALKAKLRELQLEAVETADKFQNIRKYWADNVADMILEGKSLEDVLKGIFKQIAREAIYQMFQVKQQSTILGSMGKGKGGKGAVGAVSSFNPSSSYLMGTKSFNWLKPHTGGVVGVTNIPKFHSGGTVGASYTPYLKNDESFAVLQAGEEVNSKNERRTIDVLGDVIKYMSDNPKNDKNQQPIVIYAMDSQSVAEFFSKNGDIMVSVLRQQKAFGNTV